MNKFWIPGPITSYGTTQTGFSGEVRVVLASDYDALAAELAALKPACVKTHSFTVGVCAACERDALRAEVERLRGLLDKIETVAVNDKTGCRACTEVVNICVRAALADQEKP